MKKSYKFLSMTAVIALMSTSAVAEKTVTNGVGNDGKLQVVANHSNDAFSRIDANNNGKITMKEFGRNTMHDNEPAVFKMFDQNDDGIVTRVEMENNSKTGGQTVNTIETTSNLKSRSGHTVGSLDRKFFNGTANIDNPFVDDPELVNDINIDDPITESPAVVKYSYESGTKTDDLSKSLFSQLDKNNDGSISQEEFQAGTMHDNEAEVFAMIDKNENNGISQYELSTYDKTGGMK